MHGRKVSNPRTRLNMFRSVGCNIHVRDRLAPSFTLLFGLHACILRKPAAQALQLMHTVTVIPCGRVQVSPTVFRMWRTQCFELNCTNIVVRAVSACGPREWLSGLLQTHKEMPVATMHRANAVPVVISNPHNKPRWWKQ